VSARCTIDGLVKHVTVTRKTLAAWRAKGYYELDGDRKITVEDFAAQVRRRAPDHVLKRIKDLPTGGNAGRVDPYAKPKSADGRTLAEEHLRLEVAKADLAELKAAELARSLVDVEQARVAWANIAARLRERLMAIPLDLADHLAAADTAHECEILVKAGIVEALTAFSKDPPA